MNDFLFSTWEGLLRTAGIGLLSYFALIIMLRVTGNRTLSQMNSFDFIVTIALGSTLSSGMMNKNIPFADTLVGLLLLITLQWFITKMTVKSNVVNRLVKSEPILVYYKDFFFEDQMKKVRINKDEIFASVRQDGLSSMDQVEAVVLETNGKLSSIPKMTTQDGSNKHESLLQGVQGFH